jgi:aminopeptidase YwaD
MNVMFEERIKLYLFKLANDIGPRSIGTEANSQAFDYIREVVASTSAAVSVHEARVEVCLPNRWECIVGSEQVPILPGVATLALDLKDAQVMKRVYASQEDFVRFPPEPGSIAVAALGAIHESEASILARPAAAVAYFRQGHRGLYSGNCKRLNKEPLVSGFAVEEATARQWVAEGTTVTTKIEVENRPISLRNIIADFGPNAAKPCFVAHYDSKPMSPGANDNASGVAVLLAMLQSWPKDRPARFIFFDGEEIGCAGSHAYVDDLERTQRLSEIECVICPDSVGLGELYLYTGDKHGPFPEALLELARRAFAEADWTIPERVARSGGSDFWPFHTRGVPCLFLSDFPNHVRHTTVDTIDAVKVPVLARLATVLSSERLTNRYR